MDNKKSIYLFLFVILTGGFAYRLCLATWNIFPPGADIGLHESVINSILSSKTTFFYNYYHMGGGVSVTNPGFHILASAIICLTGAPDYFVQGIIASLFSTLIILAIFMLVRQTWGLIAGFVTALLATFSASDIVMTNWAGYPNIIALSLIPILFYLFLKPVNLSSKKYLITTSILIGALFLTHLFSAIIFLTIILFTLFVGHAFSRQTVSIRQTISYLEAIFFGFILVSPYLLNVLPIYFGSEGAITGTVPIIKQAIIETRIVSTVILGLAIIPIAFFFIYSKMQTGNFLTSKSLLFSSAIIIPLAASQCYLFGFFLDYERFIYFLALPTIICLGLVLVKSAEIVSRVLSRSRIKSEPVRIKIIILSILIVVCLATPMFTLPHVGLQQANFFQVMNPTKYEAIEWIQDNTPEDSVFVANAEFGWWLSGFAKRSTLSAVDPQYLILQREFEPAFVASNILKADYLVDNGLLQIEQQGAYANDSTHEIYAIIENSIVKPLVFSLNDTRTSLLYRYGNSPLELKLGDFTQANTEVVNDGNSTSFIISRENEVFRVTEEITIFRGIRFAEVTFVFQSSEHCNFDWLLVPFRSRGEILQYANSIGIVDKTSQLINQIVLKENQLGTDVLLQEQNDYYELVCNLKGNTNAKFSFYVGLYPFIFNSENDQNQYYKDLIEKNKETYLDVISDGPLNGFNYRTAINQWNISYIAICGSESNPRFTNDPIYEIAFRNNEITIYKIVNS